MVQFMFVAGYAVFVAFSDVASANVVADLFLVHMDETEACPWTFEWVVYVSDAMRPFTSNTMVGLWD